MCTAIQEICWSLWFQGLLRIKYLRTYTGFSNILLMTSQWNRARMKTTEQDTGKAQILTSSSWVGGGCLISSREQVQIHIQWEGPHKVDTTKTNHYQQNGIAWEDSRGEKKRLSSKWLGDQIALNNQQIVAVGLSSYLRGHVIITSVIETWMNPSAAAWHVLKRFREKLAKTCHTKRVLH